MNADWDPRTLVTTRPASRLFPLGLLAAFAVIVSFVAFHHEPWRDEADPWLAVRDLDLTHFFDWTRHSGTPALWHLCLMPLTRLAFAYASQKVLHLTIAAAAVWLMATRSPLSRLTATLLTFSYYMAYEYSVIVRSYAVTVLLTFAAAALYRRSRPRPIAFALVLLLLFNCNAQGFFIAGTFAALFVIERIERRNFGARDAIAATIMAASALLAWLQVRTPPDPARQGLMRVFNRDAFAWTVSNAFLPTVPTGVGFLFGVVVLLLVTAAIRRSRQAVLLLWLPLGVLAILYSYVWLGGLRHAGFFLLLTVVAIWIAGDRDAELIDRRWAAVAAIALNLSLFVSTLVAMRYWIADIREPFSGAQEMASFIRDQKLDRIPIAAHNLTQCEALLPWLPGKRFWYAGLGEEGTYMKWDAAFERALDVPYPIAEKRSQEHFHGRSWLLLFNVEMPDPASHGFRLLHATAVPFEKTDERYWLYAPNR